MKITIEGIAKACHEANKAYCESTDDFSQPPWHLAEGWQKASAMQGIKYRIANPGVTSEQMHENWLKEKIAEGWQYGEVKNAELLRHPCMVPYSDLPAEQQVKDHLFSAICDALIPVLKPMPQATKLKFEVHPDQAALDMDKDSKPDKEMPKKKTLPSGKAMPTIKKGG